MQFLIFIGYKNIHLIFLFDMIFDYKENDLYDLVKYLDEEFRDHDYRQL